MALGWPLPYEWRENGRRLRAAAGVTPAEALEAQKRKRLELDAKGSGLEFSAQHKTKVAPLSKTVENFLKDIKTFRKPLTHQKYEYVLELFAEHAAPEVRRPGMSLPEDIKKFLAWRKSRGPRPGHHPLYGSGDSPQLLRQARDRQPGEKGAAPAQIPQATRRLPRRRTPAILSPKCDD